MAVPTLSTRGRVKLACLQKGIETLGQLAAQIGMPLGTVCQAVAKNGARQKGTRERIAAFLGCDPFNTAAERPAEETTAT